MGTAMNSTDGAQLQAARFLLRKKGPLFRAAKKRAGYHRHSVEILPTSRRCEQLSKAQLAIEFSDFSFAYKGGRRALDRISLGVRKGEFVALMGETGSGKSTLLLALNGIVPAMAGGKAGGRLFVMGKEPAREGVKNMSRLVSFVFQNPDDQIFAGTVIEEATFGPLNHGACWRDAERAAKAALAKVGLAGFEQRDPSELSFGQRQKLAIASALAMDTPIMAFDEPVSGMDYRSACGIYSILEMLHNEGKTILVVEHSDYVHSLAGKFVLMKDGQVAAQGGRAVLSSAVAKELGIRGARGRAALPSKAARGKGMRSRHEGR